MRLCNININFFIGHLNTHLISSSSKCLEEAHIGAFISYKNSLDINSLIS